MTPHPAGHSRQTVENQDATPGTSCSFGTTSGRIVSLACWQPPLAAAAPDTLTILKKSRRFMDRLLQPGSNRGWPAVDARGSARPIKRARSPSVNYAHVRLRGFFISGGKL